MTRVLNLANGLVGIGQDILGAFAGDLLGYSVGGGGDFNGDGIADIVIGAPGVDSFYGNNVFTNAGAAYVIFGGVNAFLNPIDLNNLGNAGFSLFGEGALDYAGRTVESGGDFDGDGIDDLLVGASETVYEPGQAYVVFGDSNGFQQNQLLGVGSFRVFGAYAGDGAGTGIASVGDVDGDGLDDFVIGSPGFGYGANIGGASLIHGDQALYGDISLFNSGNFFYSFYSPQAGVAVGGDGDFNGDGRDDFLIAGNGYNYGGRIFVVFGQDDRLYPRNMELLSTYNAGFAIIGEFQQDFLNGGNVDFIGDVNGDGFADIGVGAPNNGTNGAAYIVFGGPGGFPANLSLGNLGNGGIKIVGENPGDAFGFDIQSAGDFNGDGIDDVVITAYGYTSPGNNAGAVYVVFGQPGLSGPIVLDDLNDQEGVKYIGSGNDKIRSAQGVNDVNGDGFSDLMIGKPGASNGAILTGAANLLFGFAQLDGTAAADNYAGGTGRDSLIGGDGNDVLVGKGGNDSLFGGSDADSLDGGTEDDMLVSGTGNDSMFGGNGVDTAVLDFGDKDDFQVRLISGSQLTSLLTLPDPGSGSQAVFTGAAVRMKFGGGEAGFQLLASDIEKVQFGDGTVDLSDLVDVSLAATGIENLIAGGTGDNRMVGDATDDVMAAGAGNDTLDGAGGADRAYGQAGNDLVGGGVGNDSLFGNLGNDTVMGGAGNDSMKAQTDDDIIMGEGGNDTAFGGGNNDSIDGGADSDVLNGNSGFDTVLGGAGNDTLRGQGGRDSLNGGDGNDLLLGMQGFDTLVGGNGNDTLIGGPANDTLTGGGGVDTFTFGSGQGSNTITDFADNSDKILIQGFVFADLNIASGSGGATITVDGDDLTITVAGIGANQLTTADFIFG